MNNILLWLFISFALIIVELHLTAKQIGNHFCGFGAIDGVNQKTALAPMAYRVLFPWIIGSIEKLIPGVKSYRLTIYMFMKFLVCFYALLICDYALGTDKALLVAALIPVTFMFDYWDNYIELAAFASALSGNWYLTYVNILLLGFSRETAPLIGLAYLLKTGDFVSGITFIAIGYMWNFTVRQAVGYKKLYCERIMLRRNWNELKLALSLSLEDHNPLMMDYSLFSVLLTITAIILAITGNLGQLWPIPLIILVLGWVCGIAREVRIFTPVFLFIAIGFIK